jgi:hypothetical protein
MEATNRKIDLNALLTGANLLMLSLIVLESFRLLDSPYVNDRTLLLGALLCVQTQLALIVERFNRDPFVILLTFVTIFYYELRVFTLSYWGFSDVFMRYPFDADDTNFALQYMLIANLFLYAGLFSVRMTASLGVEATGWKATSAGRVVIVLLAAIIFTYLGAAVWGEGGMPRVINFIVLLLSPSMLLMLVLAYYVVYRKSLGPGTALAIFVLVVIEVALHTAYGSRSAIVGVLQTLLLILLAVRGRLKFNRGLVLAGVAALPVLAALLVATFAISSYNRFNRERGAPPDLERAAEFVSASTNDPLIVARLGIIAPVIASRAGFFDYSAEIIAHREEYGRLFTVGTYFKSVVDNMLTPGFDLFDQPKISNSLQFIYRRWGTPSRTYVANEAYQSDQIGIYGEFYMLMGWGSLPAYFLLAFLLKRIYVRLSSSNPFIFAMKRVVVLFVFQRMIDSFGMDWTIVETVPVVMAIFIYAKFFTSRSVSTGEPSRPGYAAAR